jgi:hypothetical protein
MAKVIAQYYSDIIKVFNMAEPKKKEQPEQEIKTSGQLFLENEGIV